MSGLSNVVGGRSSVLRKLALVALGALTIVSFAPLASGLLAGAVASLGGCTLDEGSTHPCVIGGHDFGDALYTGFVLTWLVLIAWPGMLVTVALWGWVVVRRLKRRPPQPARRNDPSR